MSVSGVSSADVETSLGRPLTDPEGLQVSQWIGDAELQIRLRLGDLALLDADALAFVVREAVVQRVRNPDPSLSYDSIDDYRRGFTPESRRVTIIEDWWRMLDPTTGSGAFSARPYFTPDTPDLTLDWT